MTAIVLAGKSPANALGSGGYVIETREGCDYFLVATKSGIDLMEWFSGATPDKDDFLVGSNSAFHSYGFQDVYDKTQSEGTHVYVEDYDLSEDDALDKLNSACS